MSLVTNGKTSPPSTATSTPHWSASQYQRSPSQLSQHETQQNVASSSAPGRRILPSPVLKQESEKARNVRLLLAKHQEQVNQLLQLRVTQEMNITKDQINEIPVKEEGNVRINVDEEDDEDDLQFLSARLPGNSFPATSPLMVATSMADSVDLNDSEDEDDPSNEDKELLKRLKQGQARMEQIKRMLVTQRGFIVESLRKMAQSNSDFQSKKESELRCIHCSSQQRKSIQDNAPPASMEQDRTLGRVFVDYTVQERRTESEQDVDRISGRLCPMCEAVFPQSVTNEDFEGHVMEHFNFEDSDTLIYNPQDSG